MLKVQSVEAVFAQRLKEVRDSLKLSQARLARLLAERRGLELDPTAITRIERGTRSISLNEGHAIAEVLGASLDDMCRTSRGRTRKGLQRALAAAEKEAESAQATAEMAEYQRQMTLGRMDQIKEELAALTESDDGDGEREVATDTVLRPRTYDQARGEIAALFRTAHPVTVDAAEMTQHDADRLRDFAEGLIFALHGRIVTQGSLLSLRPLPTWDIAEDEPTPSGEAADGPY